MMKHDDVPYASAKNNPEIDKAVAQILESTYVESIKPLASDVKGKTVQTSQGGRTGYILYFEGGTYLVSYLAEFKLRWRFGRGCPSDDDISLIDSHASPDVSAPQNVDLPYASEENNTASEVAKSHGQVVAGIAFGMDSFNLVFADNHEIDATLIPNSEGQKGLRVFWEQW